jgi:hypothetical protein
MTPEVVFSIVSTGAIVPWLLLVFRPRARWVATVAGTAVPLAFALVYVAIVVLQIGRGPGDFNSLAGVSALFSNPWVLLAGWIHYLAFDLLVGVWEVRDSERHGIPHLAVVPCLVLTFLFGPAGWLLYQGIRSYKIKAE